MAKQWNDGAIELTWNYAGQIQLRKATPKSPKDMVFSVEEKDSLWETIKASGLNADVYAVRLYGKERHENGSNAHMAIPGDITKERQDGSGERVVAYSAEMIAKFEPVEVQIRVIYGKPSLWAYLEAPEARGGRQAKPLPSLAIKRVDVKSEAPEAPRGQVNRVNKR